MRDQCVISTPAPSVSSAGSIFAPGHLGALTRFIPVEQTSLLEFLIWPLRGEPRDLPPDVRSWLRYLSMDVAVAGRPIRIVVSVDPHAHLPLKGRILAAETIGELLAADDSDDSLRVLAQASGAEEVSRCIGTFFLETLRMAHTSLWQETGGPVISLLATIPVTGALRTLRMYEEVVTGLERGGWPAEMVIPVMVAVESFILGSALDMVAPATMFDPGLLSADVPAFASAVAARDAAAAGECRPPADLAFEVGLASLIEGLRGVLRSLQPTG